MNKDTLKRILRWSVVNSMLIAISLCICYFLTGGVPKYSPIEIIRGETINLPFTLSRWWDFLAGPIFAVTGVLYSDRDDDFITTMNVTLMVIGLMVGMWFILFSASLALSIGLLRFIMHKIIVLMEYKKGRIT